MAAFSLRAVEETWEPSLADGVTYERHNGRRLLYHCTYILCQINNARIAKHAAFLTLEHALCTGVSGTIQVGLPGNIGEYKNPSFIEIVSQKSCGTEMTHCTKKHVVDYCSACGIAHIVVQRTLHRKYLQEKRVGAER